MGLAWCGWFSWLRNSSTESTVSLSRQLSQAPPTQKSDQKKKAGEVLQCRRSRAFGQTSQSPQLKDRIFTPKNPDGFRLGRLGSRPEADPNRRGNRTANRCRSASPAVGWRSQHRRHRISATRRKEQKGDEGWEVLFGRIFRFFFDVSRKHCEGFFFFSGKSLEHLHFYTYTCIYLQWH